MGVRRIVPLPRKIPGRAVEDDALPHEHEPLDEPLDRAELVRDVQDRHVELAVEALEQRRERLLRLGVDSGRRLVEHEQRRLGGERLGDERALLLAAGELRERPLGGRREADPVERVGLADRARAPLATLSGGQQQRAFIAKALAGEPELLVLDEPTAGVDVDAQESFATLLEELHRHLEVTILFVSHEFGAVERFVDRLVLVRGAIVFDGDPAELPSTWHDPSHVHP